MEVLRGLVTGTAFLFLSMAFAAHNPHRKHRHRFQSFPNGVMLQKGSVEKNPLSGGSSSMKFVATVTPPVSVKEAKASPKEDDSPSVTTEDLMRARASVDFTKYPEYAQLQPKKSLIGAIVIFALYFLATVVYNYIRKVAEKDRVDKALREYEEEKEHYIETGETADVVGDAV
uniref:Putative membrane protein n=1 Tax=Babesia bovis TaxID=5865 RepID=Q7Z100_BABBO|nr:putative membrane protein [Babesia bovis]